MWISHLYRRLEFSISLYMMVSYSCLFGLGASEETTLATNPQIRGLLQAQDTQPDRKTAYLTKRAQWLREDAAINFSHGLRLTFEEQILDRRIKAIVKNLQTQFLVSNLFCPARNFLSIKNCIETSPLFSILKKMPKGGILHLHTSSSGDANWLVKRAIADENCYIYTQDDGSVLQGKMEVFPKGTAPPGFRPMHELAEKDNHFITKVVEMITLTPEDSTSPNPWDKFEACFERVGGLVYYAPIFTDYYRQSFEALAADNIQIVELRAGSGEFNGLYDINGKIYSSDEVINIYRDLVGQIRKKHPDFVLKLIISDIRVIDLANERCSLETAFKLRSEHPDLVTGYDLVGFETTGHTTLFYLDNLLNAAADFSEKYDTDLPYFFHDGESDWASNLNLYDAVLLNSRRIGHAFNLFHFPLLMQKIKQNGICLEICPISNQVLGYVNDLREHPAVGYLRHGLPCVISSDDPMLFRTSGLSYDFWEAIMAWNLTLADIKKLCLNSIEYSTLDPEEKREAFASWEKAWAQFVHNALTMH